MTSLDYSQKLSKSIMYRVIAANAKTPTMYLGTYKSYILVVEFMAYTIWSM